MYLGDLKEATDFELLQQRNITAVLNLINWWEFLSDFFSEPRPRTFAGAHGGVWRANRTTGRPLLGVPSTDGHSEAPSV